jgi:hypothetical protein
MIVISHEEAAKSSREKVCSQCGKNNDSSQLWHLFVCLIWGDKFCLQELLTTAQQFSTLGISEKFFVSKVGEAQDFVSKKKRNQRRKEGQKKETNKNKLGIFSK